LENTSIIPQDTAGRTGGGGQQGNG